MKGLTYPSTYHAMKAGPCRVGVCKHDGMCGECEEYGTLRNYAARDTDRIHELRALVKELADALDAVVPDNADCEDTKALCQGGCMPNGICRQDTIRALVASANEELKNEEL